MKCYVLSVRFYTNGDYVCNYENIKEDICYNYSYSKVFLNLDKAISQSKEIIKKIQGSTIAKRESINKNLEDMFVGFVSELSTHWFKDGDKEVYFYLSGEYEGTEIRFFESEID